MRISKEGLYLIKRLEGFRNHPYLDSANVPTIGYGFTFYPNGERVKMSDKPITRVEAEEILFEVVKTFADAVEDAVETELTQNQFDALVSFAYNVGVYAFRDSTLLKRINEDPKHPDIEYQFSRWNKADGKVLNGLVRRRKSEYYLYNL
jgi:lysozyme